MSSFSYNLQSIADLIGGGITLDIASMLVGTFVGSINEEVPLLQAAVENGDLPSIHKVGHKLKGSSANLGFEEFRSLCEALEQHARNNLDFDYKTTFSKLLEEKAKIEAWYNSIS